MKFLVDAQLPKKVSLLLCQLGFDSVHTLELPLKNSTSDADLNRISLNEKRILISKDTDFVHSYKLKKEPYKLLLISTGNIHNLLLLNILKKNLDSIIKHFKSHSFLELSKENLIIHH